MEIKVDSILDGTVKSITKFGAFVVLPGGRSGLVHISEISHSYVNDVKDHLQEGQEVKIKVVGIDEAGRINLSIKKAMDPPPQQANPRNNRPQGAGNFRPRENNREGGNFTQNRPAGAGFSRNNQNNNTPTGGFSRRGNDEGRNNNYRSAPVPKANNATGSNDFENMMKQFMQNSDSKLSTLRMHEKRSSRRSGHH